MLQLPSDIPSSIPIGSKIYKDDCMYTFDTPENNPLGLDIDLKTYKAYSRTHNYNYTKSNYLETGNRYYLNITKTLKPQQEQPKLYDDEGETPPKIQKLEIKPVKDEDYYNTSITIYDVAEDKSYTRDQVSPEFNSLIDEILAANSSNTQDEIQTWQQEIHPCEHSLTIPPTEVEAVDLSKCHDCDLKENLWICLYCGSLGCGRQQFGSDLKGNGHALGHFESSKHPVAVKLGSLSQEGEGYDAYCYLCNEEVKIPDLAEKLSPFGIDLSKSIKTEKNLVELNIAQNLNWEFRLDGANGEKLPPVYGKGLTGFANLGNSCYLNSVIQALFNLDTYQTFFKSLIFPPYNVNPAENLCSQLIKIYDGLYSGRYSVPGQSLKGDDYQLGLKPSAFKTLIGENHPEFRTLKQQDAFEFLLYLLDKLDTEFGITLNQSLKFVTGHKTICSNCAHGSIRHELVDNISVPIQAEVLSEIDGKIEYKPVELIDSFRQYCETEAIEGYDCDECKVTPNVAFKTSGFSSFPDYLIVNIQRIVLQNWVPVKIDVPVEIPYELDLGEFVAPEFEDEEIEIKKNEEEASESEGGFVANQEALNMLLGMGFPEVRCLKALYNTGNSDAEAATNWLFSHMDDPDIDSPFNPTPAKKNTEPDEELIGNLTSMGFTKQLAKKALILNSNQVEAAVDWLFSNPDDDGTIPETAKPIVNISQEKSQLLKTLLEKNETNGTKYRLQSVICHKGTSPHTGHYVVFIRKLIDGEWKWVLFNDEKVVLCDETSLQDMRSTGYVYIFEKIKS
ncbi:ubp14 [[Candida] subhashii]|uniref:Ubiquitin carboxyl-terminal hydrolase n=1 Tax=[Candida] subhashii TaxID=561895 RepID=A0A8J5V0K3_9ASCO|nr:ubp14 [[Candida] subhashii]KAG7665525.1 ubp14 [[Candida] subhashii]